VVGKVLTTVMLFWMVHFNLTGQECYSPTKGTVKASATISPSVMLNRNQQNIYLSGFLEGFLDEKISLRGDALWYIDGMGNQSPYYRRNSSILFGGFVHISKKNWDTSLGFQPGLQLSTRIESGENYTRFSPVLSFQWGNALYVWKYFHFFMNVQYIQVTLRGGGVGSMRSDELLLSAGLGFQLGCRQH
jgi:hypothetical protein